MAAQVYSDAPETVIDNYPEVAPPPDAVTAAYAYGAPAAAVYPTYSTPPVMAAVKPEYQPLPDQNGAAKGVATPPGGKRLLFILASLAGLLAAAVIALAATTGVEANRASRAETSLAALQKSLSATATPTTSGTGTGTGTATTTSASSSSAPTTFDSIDNNCSSDPDGVSGTKYSSYKLFGEVTFTTYCDQDAAGTPLMSLFVANFDKCMDACSAFSLYEPGLVGTNNSKTDCAAVSFIPLWTDEFWASKGSAPGNCYLKPGPQTKSNLTTPNIGTKCHAAIVD